MGFSSNLRYQMLNGLDMVRKGACLMGGHRSVAAGCGWQPACCFRRPAPPARPSPPPPWAPPPPCLQVLQPIMPTSLFRLFTSIIRGLNNMAGGISFVVVAKALGVQKAAEAAPAAPVVVDDKKGKKKK